MKITLTDYYKSFRGFYLLLAGVPFVLPFLRQFLSDSGAVAEYCFPPLGNAQPLACTLTAILLLVSTFLVYIFRGFVRKVSWRVWGLLIMACLFGGIAIIGLYTLYVVEVPVPSVGLNMSVSIGYERTQFAKRTYPGWSDSAIIHDHGFRDGEIKELWTLRSLATVRILLWSIYSCVLCCLVAMICLGVYEHALERSAKTFQHRGEDLTRS